MEDDLRNWNANRIVAEGGLPIPKAEERRKATDPVYSLRIRPDLIARLDVQCKQRLVGRRLLIEAAIERLLSQLEED